MEARLITLTLNGQPLQAMAEPRMHLADFLRQAAALPSVRVSCEYGVCGCCSLLLNGEVVRGCLVLAVQADGAEIGTLEGLNQSGAIADLQESFVRRNAMQCGYCTPAMLLTAQELLAADPDPSREAVREHLSGNYCRCTGYHAIVDAVMETAATRRQAMPAKAGDAA